MFSSTWTVNKDVYRLAQSNPVRRACNAQLPCDRFVDQSVIHGGYCSSFSFHVAAATVLSASSLVLHYCCAAAATTAFQCCCCQQTELRSAAPINSRRVGPATASSMHISAVAILHSIYRHLRLSCIVCSADKAIGYSHSTLRQIWRLSWIVTISAAASRIGLSAVIWLPTVDALLGDMEAIGTTVHTPGWTIRVRSMLAEFSDCFSEFGTYIAPSYRHDRCER